MSRRRGKGPCFRCGATLYLSNCPPDQITDPCPDCGQCSCLRRNENDYEENDDAIRSQ